MSRLDQIREVMKIHAELHRKKLQWQNKVIDEDVVKEGKLLDKIKGIFMKKKKPTEREDLLSWMHDNNAVKKASKPLSRPPYMHVGAAANDTKPGKMMMTTTGYHMYENTTIPVDEGQLAGMRYMVKKHQIKKKIDRHVVKEHIQESIIRTILRKINPILKKTVNKKIERHTELWDQEITKRAIRHLDGLAKTQRLDMDADNAQKRMKNALDTLKPAKAAAEAGNVTKFRKRRDKVQGVTNRLDDRTRGAIRAWVAWKDLRDGIKSADARKPGDYFKGKK